MLRILESFRDNERVTFGDILLKMHERGFGILLMLFILPNLIPIPGFTAIGSIPVFFISAQMAMKLDHPWFPKWVEKKSVSFKNFEAAVYKFNSYLRKSEKFIKPRLVYLCEGRGERAAGISCLILTAVFAMPIPLGNFFPVMGILLISLGVFNKDGLLVILGNIIGIIGIIVNILLVKFGVNVLIHLEKFVQGKFF